MPASSPMIGPSAAVIVSSGPTGAAPCETQGRISTPSKRIADRALRQDLVAEQQRRLRLGRAGRGEAAEQRQHRHGARQLAQHRVGRERERVGEQRARPPRRSGRAGRRARRRRRRSPRPRRGTSVASPPSSAAAQTDTAVPSSTSRISPITPPAPQPTSSAGASASWMPSSVASGAARCAPLNATRRRGRTGGRRARRARPPPPPRRRSARPPPSRGRCRCVRPSSTDLTRPRRSARTAPPCDPAAVIVALFGPTGVGKTEVAIALAEALRADGEDPVAVSADALQLYAGLEILTGARHARSSARGSSTGCVGVAAARPARATAGDFARRAHAEIDALVAAGRRPIVVGGTGLYLRAALADLDLRPPPDPARARALRAPDRRRGGARAPRRPARAQPRGRRRGSPPPTRSASPARSSCSTPARRRPPATSCGPPHTRLPTLLVALTMERAALYARIDARVDAMVAAGARGRGAARRRRRRLAVRAPGARASPSCSPATSPR